MNKIKLPILLLFASATTQSSYSATQYPIQKLCTDEFNEVLSFYSNDLGELSNLKIVCKNWKANIEEYLQEPGRPMIKITLNKIKVIERGEEEGESESSANFDSFLRKIGESLHPDRPIFLDFSRSKINDRQLQSVCDILQERNIQRIDLSRCFQITDLTPLRHLVSLTQLNLSFCSQIKDISFLANLVNMTRLNLTSCFRITDHSFLANLVNMTQLILWGCYQITDISSLANLVSLADLDLEGCSQITDISSLEHLTNLADLDLSCSNIPAEQIHRLQEALPKLQIWI